MTACLRALRRHRGRRLKSRTFAGIPGYAISAGEGVLGPKTLLAWFPARAVDRLVDLGMISYTGALTPTGLAQIGERDG